MQYERPEEMPLLDPRVANGITEELPLARLWAQRQLRSALATQPGAGSVLSGPKAVQALTEIRDHLIQRCGPIIDAYSPLRWLWYLRRTDYSIIRGYLPNTETSIMRIAENLSGLSKKTASDDSAVIAVPLTFGIDTAAFARLARLLAIAELVNHSEGWLRRSSKNAEFIMVEGEFPDLVENLQLESAIEEFDERVVAAASNRWHPSLSEVSSTGSDHVVLSISMLNGGIGKTPMWKGSIVDTPEPFQGEGRFAITPYSLRDQSNAEQLRGSLMVMESPEIVAAFVVLSQALMWHAMFYSENLGISIPRVGYVLLREVDLLARIDVILSVVAEKTWPAMDGFVPQNSASVVSVVESVSDGSVISAPGPVIRRWQDGTLAVDAYALTTGIFHRLRMESSAGGARVNVPALEFELEVQKVIDTAGMSPLEPVRKLRGKTLRLNGESITDIDALMVVGGTLVCISCKKFELARAYDAGDYQSVRNARTNVEAAVTDWAKRLAVLNKNRVGDNFDFSMFSKVVGMVVTPELAFVESPAARAFVNLAKKVVSRAYISFGELRALVDELTA